MGLKNGRLLPLYQQVETPFYISPTMVSKSRLLDQVREKIRLKHYSIRTEQAYLDWIKRFILFHGKRHPENMGNAEVEQFLTHLAVERNVAASTQNQALNAIVFLYKEVLGQELGWLDNMERAKRPARECTNGNTNGVRHDFYPSLACPPLSRRRAAAPAPRSVP